MLRSFLTALIALFLLTSCTEAELASHVAKSVTHQPDQGTFKVGKPYQVFGKTYVPEEDYNLIETGIASWYGPNFHGKQTANGEIFDQNELTAAHRTLHMPSIVRVTNLENGRSLVVRVNDRGPFKRGRVIDLSKRAAELLGFKNQGTAKVRLQVLPEESRKIAQLAKRGLSTRGYEVAMNNRSVIPASSNDDERQRMTPMPASTGSQEQTLEVARLTKVDRVALDSAGQVTGHTKNGNFYPDPVVKTVPVTPTGIFVQAASFSSSENALRFAQQLSKYGQAQVMQANVNGQVMHRVRLGPIANVDKADQLLAQLANSGNNGIIVVE